MCFYKIKFIFLFLSFFAFLYWVAITLGKKTQLIEKKQNLALGLCFLFFGLFPIFEYIKFGTEISFTRGGIQTTPFQTIIILAVYFASGLMLISDSISASQFQIKTLRKINLWNSPSRTQKTLGVTLLFCLIAFYSLFPTIESECRKDPHQKKVRGLTQNLIFEIRDS